MESNLVNFYDNGEQSAVKCENTFINKERDFLFSCSFPRESFNTSAKINVECLRSRVKLIFHFNYEIKRALITSFLHHKSASRLGSKEVKERGKLTI